MLTRLVTKLTMRCQESGSMASGTVAELPLLRMGLFMMDSGKGVNDRVEEARWAGALQSNGLYSD